MPHPAPGKWLPAQLSLCAVLLVARAAAQAVAFFPPTPPVSGSVIGANPFPPFFPNHGRRALAPEDVADYVGENFYAPLGARLFAGKLSDALQKQLAAYRAQRAAALTDLQNELVEVQNLPPAEQEKALQAFAEKQAKPLAQLEEAADALRRALIHGGVFDSNWDWNAERSQRLGGSPGRFAGLNTARFQAALEFQVLRAAIFYQDGLSPEQRDLLDEITLETQEQAQPRLRRPGSKDDPAKAFFFSPGGARYFLPENLPTELDGKIRDYERAKFEEKKILHDTIVALDVESAGERTKALRALADSQAPRLARMEAFAEEVRRGLAQLPPPPLPVLPPKLPPKLTERFVAYRREAQALAAEQTRYLASHRSPPKTFQGHFTSEEIRAHLDEIRASFENAIAEFRAENAERFAALRAEREAILKDADEFAHLNTDPATGQPMDVRSLAAYVKAADDYFARVGRDEAIYADYNRAMLLPGLSPAQRRLLFHTAVAGLAQPLPNGQELPTENSISVGYN
ncbi:MAG TPA: hypothetical protein VHD62_02295 [Opitutaceae bacterium]|nr:hypothetical protein [Opitutaceae bacterium]